MNLPKLISNKRGWNNWFIKPSFHIITHDRRIARIIEKCFHIIAADRWKVFPYNRGRSLTIARSLESVGDRERSYGN